VTDNGTPNLSAFETITITVNEVSDAPVTLSFQDGVFPDASYSGTRDTRIRGAGPNESYGLGTNLYADSSPLYSTLLKWDLSAISPGSTVQSVSLTVNVFDKTVDGFEIYELKRNWVETETTWSVSSAGNAWQGAGAQGANDRGSTVLGILTASATGAVTISFNAAGLAVVQGWINQPATNHGIIVQDYTNGPDSIGFLSREATPNLSRPKLTVSFLPGGSGMAATVIGTRSPEPDAWLQETRSGSQETRRQQEHRVSEATPFQPTDHYQPSATTASLSLDSCLQPAVAVAPLDRHDLTDALDSLLSSFESIQDLIAPKGN
jgi:hypothetical protein